MTSFSRDWPYFQLLKEGMMPKLEMYNAASLFSTQNHVTTHSTVNTLVSFSWVFVIPAFEVNLSSHIWADPEFPLWGEASPGGFAMTWAFLKRRKVPGPLVSPHKAEKIGREEGVGSPLLYLIWGKFNELALFSTLVAATKSKWAQFLDQDFS